MRFLLKFVFLFGVRLDAGELGLQVALVFPLAAQLLAVTSLADADKVAGSTASPGGELIES
jgi:hypothetical protein